MIVTSSGLLSKPAAPANCGVGFVDKCSRIDVYAPVFLIRLTLVRLVTVSKEV